jgi:hypothetical protein
MPQRLQDGGTRRKLGLCLPKLFEGLFDSLSIRVAHKVHGISTSRAHRVHTGGAERVQTLPVDNRIAGGTYPHDPLDPVCSRVALPIGDGTNRCQRYSSDERPQDPRRSPRINRGVSCRDSAHVLSRCRVSFASIIANKMLPRTCLSLSLIHATRHVHRFTTRLTIESAAISFRVRGSALASSC